MTRLRKEDRPKTKTASDETSVVNKFHDEMSTSFLRQSNFSYEITSFQVFTRILQKQLITPTGNEKVTGWLKLQIENWQILFSQNFDCCSKEGRNLLTSTSRTAVHTLSWSYILISECKYKFCTNCKRSLGFGNIFSPPTIIITMSNSTRLQTTFPRR